MITSRILSRSAYYKYKIDQYVIYDSTKFGIFLPFVIESVQYDHNSQIG
jgi:ACT domain-containing protein